MKSVVLSVATILSVAAVALTGSTGPSEARRLSSTQTNVCTGGFCADVTRIVWTNSQKRAIAIHLRSWPRSDHRNLRCENGAQWQGVSGTCGNGATVSVQACTKPTFGRSRCAPWVVFR